MKSRYNGLRTIGTLALILAWIMLILGIVAGVAAWLGVRGVENFLTDLGSTITFGPAPILAAIPGVLSGLLGFLVWYAVGKGLHLLVDLDERTLEIRRTVEQPAASGDGMADASGEMKRQAKLIAANLEATQDLQRQMTSLESKLTGVKIGAGTAAAAGAVAVSAAAAADTSADNAAEAVADATDDATKAVAAAVDETTDAVADVADGAADAVADAADAVANSASDAADAVS